MLFKTKKTFWRDDEAHSFKIDKKVIADYFDKTQSLVFSSESADAEEGALMKYIDVNDESKVLDLGCGNGRWGRILIPKCKKYVGVDLSKNFIAKLNKKYNTHKTMFYHMSAQDYLVEEKFDLILIIGLTTYMNDDNVERMANNCSKMLTQKGKIIVRSIALNENGNKRKVFYRESGLIGKILRKPDYQIIRRSPGEEMRLFSKFALEHQGYIQGTGYTFYVLSLKEKL